MKMFTRFSAIAALLSAVCVSAPLHAAIIETVAVSEDNSVGDTTDAGLTAIDFVTPSLLATDGLATFQVQFTAEGFDSEGPAALDHNPVNGDYLGVNSGTNDWEMDGNGKVEFSGLSVTNFNANGGSLSSADIVDLAFTFVTFDFAGASFDSGSTLGNTWQDINGSADFAGHEPANAGINLETVNGGTGPGAFDVTWVNGSWRIESVAVGYNVVPEPGAVALLGLGGLALIGPRRRRPV